MLLPLADKSLGQHWLTDKLILDSIVSEAQLKKGELVLEVGPGLGSLTDRILEKTDNLLAVEFDYKLYGELIEKYKEKNTVTIINQDILKFNFNQISQPYKIIANIPYYLTSNLLRVLSDIDNPPVKAVLLVQKEVAERINANPAQHSKLSIFTQNVFQTQLGPLVPAKYFTPPPKVDSQVIILTKRAKEVVPFGLKKQFSVLVKAGFAEKRKKLRSSLSGGLNLSKEKIDELLAKSNIDPSARAQELSINNWIEIASNFTK